MNSLTKITSCPLDTKREYYRFRHNRGDITNPLLEIDLEVYLEKTVFVSTLISGIGRLQA